MKRINILLSLLIIPILCAFGQQEWVPLESGTNYYLESVFFIENIGYAVGGSVGTTNHNIVLKTLDRGKTWSNICNPEYEFKSVFFTNIQTGFAVDYKGILQTEDGGITWQRRFDNKGFSSFQDLKSIYFVDSMIGYCVGGFINFSPIMKTTDGGKNWINKSNELGLSLTSCCFVDTNIGYAVGYSGNIIKTIDGGNTWTKQTSGTTNILFSVFFINDKIGWAVGYGGVILKTNNGGNTWSIQKNKISNSLFSVFFTDSLNGCTVGGMADQWTRMPEYDETILVTKDGGENWIAQSSGRNSNLFSVFYTDINTGYSVGAGGTILMTKSGRLDANSIAYNFTNDLVLFPNPSKDSFTLKINRFSVGTYKIIITNMSGHKIIERTSSNATYEFKEPKLTQGFYFVSVIGEDFNYTIKMIIK